MGVVKHYLLPWMGHPPGCKMGFQLPWAPSSGSPCSVNNLLNYTWKPILWESEENSIFCHPHGGMYVHTLTLFYQEVSRPVQNPSLIGTQEMSAFRSHFCPSIMTLTTHQMSVSAPRTGQVIYTLISLQKACHIDPILKQGIWDSENLITCLTLHS